MAQCFVTTYRNHYRWQQPKFTKNFKPEDKFVSVIPPEDIWFEDQDPEILTEQSEDWLHKCYQKRYISSYQRDFGEKRSYSQDQSPMVNCLLTQNQKLYDPFFPRPKITAPSAGSRKVFGYIRPSGNYTPLTTYQEYYNQVAYNILKTKEPEKENEKNFETSRKLRIKHRENNATIVSCDCCENCMCCFKIK